MRPLRDRRGILVSSLYTHKLPAIGPLIEFRSIFLIALLARWRKK
jgi:hypothetical protein